MLTQFGISQPIRAQENVIAVGAEIPVGTASGRNLTNFAVHQIRAGAKSVLLAPSDQGVPVDEIVEDIIEAVTRKQGLHGRFRILLARTLKCAVGRRVEVGRADLLVSYGRNTVSTCHTAECTRIGDIHAGEGEPDQDQEGQGQCETDFGLEEIPEKREHGLRRCLFVCFWPLPAG